MKKATSKIAIVLMATTFFTSCTIHKRVHQRGYHIAWSAFKNSKNKTEHSKETANNSTENPSIIEGYQADEKVLYSSTSDEIILENVENATVVNGQDTVVPGKSGSNDEYFDRKANEANVSNYSRELPGKEQANLSLGFGIVAITSPLWTLVLIMLLGAASSFALEAVATAMVIGILVASLMIILALAMGISFIKKHGKDPAYAQYKQRAVTGIVLASIIPGIVFALIFLVAALG